MFKKLYSHEKVCTCDCHKDDENILCFVVCCHLSSKKYITNNNELDEGRLFRALNPPRPKKRRPKKRKKRIK